MSSLASIPPKATAQKATSWSSAANAGNNKNNNNNANTTVASTNNSTNAAGGAGKEKGVRKANVTGSRQTHSRSYPRGVGLDFRKLAGITLINYIDHHGTYLHKAPCAAVARSSLTLLYVLISNI
jgi:hypothetical protein